MGDELKALELTGHIAASLKARRKPSILGAPDGFGPK